MRSEFIPFAVKDWNDKIVSRHMTFAAAKKSAQKSSMAWPATCHVIIRPQWVEKMEQLGRDVQWAYNDFENDYEVAQ